MSAVIEARRWSDCPACEQKIRPGERITPDPFDGAGETWIHEQCPEVKPPRPVCTSCFLEITPSGACGCDAL